MLTMQFMNILCNFTPNAQAILLLSIGIVSDRAWYALRAGRRFLQQKQTLTILAHASLHPLQYTLPLTSVSALNLCMF